MKEEKPMIAIEHVSFSYGEEKVLHDIHLEIFSGSFVGVVGPNGGGKSTLLKLILGLLPLQKGMIKIFNTPREYFRQWDKIGYVSQKANAFNRGFPATVYEIVRSGLVGKSGLFRFFPKDTKEKVLNALKAVDMEAYAQRNISELSGGQQQRVFIARALVTNPQILILDEPTVGVDREQVESFMKLLKKLNRQQGITVILVSHDWQSIKDSLTHVLHLNRTIRYYGDPKNYMEKQLAKELPLAGGEKVVPDYTRI